MKNELSKFERVADGAYFTIDIRAFGSTLTPYDPLVANQTIVIDQEPSRSAQDVPRAYDDPDMLNT